MRLHLDTGSAAGSTEATSANSALSAAEKAATGLNTSAAGTSSSGPNLRDSVAVSGTSSAWSTSFSDRAARIGQLTAAVQSGTYRVSGAAISQSIVASATK